jgi:hypothetical protein
MHYDVRWSCTSELAKMLDSVFHDAGGDTLPTGVHQSNCAAGRMRQVHGHAIGHGHCQENSRGGRDVPVQAVLQQQPFDSPFMNTNGATVHLTACDYPTETGTQLAAEPPPTSDNDIGRFAPREPEITALVTASDPCHYPVGLTPLHQFVARHTDLRDSSLAQQRHGCPVHPFSSSPSRST